MRSWNEKGPVLAFLCNWAPYLCWMEMSRSAMVLPFTVYPIKTRCAGRVDPAMILYAFEHGAEGVMVFGCRERDCRYGSGPGRVERLSETVHGLMHVLGLEAERFSTTRCASDEMEVLFRAMGAFGEKIDRLGRSPWSRRSPGAVPIDGGMPVRRPERLKTPLGRSPLEDSP